MQICLRHSWTLISVKDSEDSDRVLWELLSEEGSQSGGRGGMGLGMMGRAWLCRGTKKGFSGKGNVCGKDTEAVN